MVVNKKDIKLIFWWGDQQWNIRKQKTKKPHAWISAKCHEKKESEWEWRAMLERLPEKVTVTWWCEWWEGVSHTTVQAKVFKAVRIANVRKVTRVELGVFIIKVHEQWIEAQWSMDMRGGQRAGQVPGHMLGRALAFILFGIRNPWQMLSRWVVYSDIVLLLLFFFLFLATLWHMGVPGPDSSCSCDLPHSFGNAGS